MIYDSITYMKISAVIITYNEEKRLEEAAFITDVPAAAGVNELPDISDAKIRIEIENCLSVLAARGLEVYIIDLTDPLLRLPAFYVIIPGACFFQRAENASAGMFSAKLVAENFPAPEAIPRLLKMRTLMGETYYLSFYLGLCHLASGDIDSSLACLRRALDLSPAAQDIPSIYSYLGQALKERGQYREALEALEKGLAHDDERQDVLNLAGFCHFKLGEHEKAIERFAAILRIDPSSAIDYANMAVNYRHMGDISQAVYYYQQALAIDPTIDFASQHLAELLSKPPSE